MKVEKMIMAKYGLRYGDANKVVKLARQRLGIAPSVAWTEELEAEARRLCDGETDGGGSGDGGSGGGAAPQQAPLRDSSSTAPTSSSGSTAAPSQRPASPSETPRTTAVQRIASDEIGCWTVPGSSEAQPFAGRKTVADLQHETLLEGPEVRREGAPKLPVRRCSDPSLDDARGADAGDEDEDDHSRRSGGHSGNGDMPLPQIRPLRRTDNRTKYA